MRTAKRTLSVLLLALLLVCVLGINVSAAGIIDSGSCSSDGSSVTWTLDSAGTLTISGKGPMGYYDPDGWSMAWYHDWPSNSIVNVVIQNGVTHINRYAFAGCSNLKTVVIPGSVTSIGEGAFSCCSALEYVTVPDSVTEMEEGIFSRCYSLKQAKLPAGLTELPECLFSRCAKLTAVSVPDSVTEIGENAFFGCTSLQSVTLPKELQSLHEAAFMGCSSLSQLRIPTKTEHIGEAAFAGCKILKEVSVADGNTAFAVLDGILYSKDYTQLIWCSPLKSGSVTTIPDSVTEFYDLAFLNCSQLTAIDIPERVQELGRGTFAGCSSLKSLLIPDGVEYLRSHTEFVEDYDPEIPVSIPIKEYFVGLFDGCSSLKSVVLPNHLYSMNFATFRNCRSLTSITIPESVEYIPSIFTACGDIDCTHYTAGVFENCTGLTSIRIPANVDTLDGVAFRGCSSLEAVFFVGNVPYGSPECSMDEEPYYMDMEDIDATVYYPKSNSQWAAYVKKHPNAVTWKAYTPLRITVQPKNTYTDLGKTASVSLTAEGDGLTYKWFIRDIADTQWFESSNTSNACKMLISAENAGRKAFCVITDKYGNTVQSEVGQMRSTFAITAQPKTAYAGYGQTARVTVKAVGDDLTYTWYVRDVEDTKYFLSSVTKNYYPMKMSEANSNRRAYCVVTDRYGNTLRSDTVCLRLSASILTQPKHASAAIGSVARTTLKAAGDGLTYQWYIKNPGSSKFSKSSVTSVTYSVKMTADNVGRQAYCIVRDAYGKTDKSDTVTFGLPLKILTQPKAVTVKSGETAKTTVKASGDGLTYQWYVKNPGSSKFSKSSITSATYTCKMSAANDGRQVYCMVADRYGNSTKTNTVTLSMKATLAITQQPRSVTVAEGATAKVSVTATGEGLSYKWYFKNAGASKFSLTTSFTGNSYSISMNKDRDGRQVYCVISDRYGNTVTSNTVTLSMKAAPIVITTQPADASAAEGSVAKTTVKATGEGLSFQWYIKNPGGSKFSKSSVTGSTYSTKMTAANDGRQVYCLITDTRGNTLKTNTVTFTVK